jgi:RTX calcium-binding nonapeptide repeat (4 copies)
VRQGAFSSLIVAALTLSLAPAASAMQASSVSVGGGGQTFVAEFAGPGGVRNDVTVTANADSVTFTDPGGMFAGGSCQQVNPSSARCTGVRGLYAQLGAQDDRLVIDPSVSQYLAKHVTYAWVELFGGPGNDRLQAAPPDYSTYHRGQVIVRGGPGADDLAGAGASADYSDVTSGGVSVTLDGVANDGNADDESGGRRDNVGPGMSISGTFAADVLVGDAANNELEGGGGDDQITGGKGRDLVNAGDGNDEVDVRDSVADSVRCGSGIDQVKSDSRALDSVAANDCESVDALAGPCEAMDRFNAAHAKPKRFGAPARPKAGGLYLGKTSFGLPVRLNIARTRRSFVPASRFSYKWCFQERVEPVDLKISGDAIKADGRFDIVHHTPNGFGFRRVRGRFWDHSRKVSGVITDKYGSRAHGGPVTFVATLTRRK